MKKFGALIMAGILSATMVISASAAYEAEADLGKVAFNVQKATAEQKFDGKISDGEYYKIDVKSSWVSYATAKDDALAVAKATPKELYMSWNEKGVNVAAIVTIAKDAYSQTQATASNMWKEAAIQVNIAGVADTGTKRLEYGIAKNSADGKFMGNVWAQHTGTYAVEEGKNAYVNYTDGKLVYETHIPWTNFLASADVKEGSQFGFCIVWAIGKGEDHIHIQLASGCTGTPGKKAENFAKLTLAAAPEKPKTTTPTTSAKTSDAGIIISATLLAVSMAGIAIVSRKKH